MVSICRASLVVQLHKTTIAQTTNGRIHTSPYTVGAISAGPTPTRRAICS